MGGGFELYSSIDRVAVKGISAPVDVVTPPGGEQVSRR
jgi:hypothetical protein